MVYLGTVHNGVIVFERGVHLPEGAAVRVELAPKPADESHAKTNHDDVDPIFRIAELAENVGLPDLSVNIDHYLYGHPKVTDGQ